MLFPAMELAFIVVGHGCWVPYNAQIAMLKQQLTGRVLSRKIFPSLGLPCRASLGHPAPPHVIKGLPTLNQIDMLSIPATSFFF